MKCPVWLEQISNASIRRIAPGKPTFEGTEHSSKALGHLLYKKLTIISPLTPPHRGGVYPFSLVHS